MRKLVVVAAVFAVGSLIATDANAASCLRMKVSATGATMMFNKEAEAKSSAVAAWSATARVKAGPDYASWDIAQAKSLTCKPVAKSTIKCTAVATPCKP